MTSRTIKTDPTEQSDVRERITEADVRTERLEKRYHVERIGGTPGKHDDCVFFVLDPQHDPFARAALTAYADVYQADLPDLAADLRQLAAARGVVFG